MSEADIPKGLVDGLAGSLVGGAGTISDPFVVRCGAWLESAELLRRAGFAVLIDLWGVDHPDREMRFEQCAQFLNPETGLRAVLTTSCPADDPRIQSLVDVYPNAAWLEREIYDMFGVSFDGHPALQRILCPGDFPGHALRKDCHVDEEGQAWPIR